MIRYFDVLRHAVNHLLDNYGTLVLVTGDTKSPTEAIPIEL